MARRLGRRAAAVCRPAGYARLAQTEVWALPPRSYRREHANLCPAQRPRRWPIIRSLIATTTDWRSDSGLCWEQDGAGRQFGWTPSRHPQARFKRAVHGWVFEGNVVQHGNLTADV